MEFNVLAEGRRSIRAFKEQLVPDEIIMKLLEAARVAPSAGNCQPWHFYVIKNKDMIKQINDNSCKQSFLLTASFLIVVCADIPLSEKRYGQRGRDLYCIQDTAAAIQNILLSAHSNGLGACWCGAFDEAALSNLLHLDNDMRPVAIIPVGYPAQERDSRGRRPIEEIVTFY